VPTAVDLEAVKSMRHRWNAIRFDQCRRTGRIGIAATFIKEGLLSILDMLFDSDSLDSAMD
jgi:glutaredoxin-related protein